jgi:general secretion pathway protein D
MRSILPLLFALALPATATAQEPAPAADAIDFSLDGADLPELVRAVSRITGRRFILAAPVRSIQATVVGEGPVSVREVYRAFLSILHLNGLTVVRSGRYELIVSTEDIERRPIPLIVDP